MKKDKVNLLQILNTLGNFISSDDKEQVLDSLESIGIEARICTGCDSFMLEGYVIDNGYKYYCSEACLESEMSLEDFSELYDNGNGDSYYTAWERNFGG